MNSVNTTRLVSLDVQGFIATQLLQINRPRSLESAQLAATRRGNWEHQSKTSNLPPVSYLSPDSNCKVPNGSCKAEK